MSGQASNVVAFPASRMGNREPWLTRKEVAVLYGRSVRWVDYRVAEGMPVARQRGGTRMRRSAIEPWLRERGWLIEGAA